MGIYDRSSKWLIEHHGDAMLRLAGVENIVSWKPLPAEVVQPGQLPDGILDVVLVGQPDPAPFVIEIATYPERRVEEQLARDAMLVCLNRRELPEVITLVLRPKGRLRVPEVIALRSRGGGTELQLRCRVVELWTVPAENLLATDDPGLVPWAPLCRYAGRPEALLRQCRETIDRRAAEDERDSLLAVSQVLAGLRYHDRGLLSILGGRQVMIESPVIQELVQEVRTEKAQTDILRVLRRRFGEVPADLSAAVQQVSEPARLDRLIDAAADSPDLEAFRAQLGP